MPRPSVRRAAARARRPARGARPGAAVWRGPARRALGLPCRTKRARERSKAGSSTNSFEHDERGFHDDEELVHDERAEAFEPSDVAEIEEQLRAHVVGQGAARGFETV